MNRNKFFALIFSAVILLAAIVNVPAVSAQAKPDKASQVKAKEADEAELRQIELQKARLELEQAQITLEKLKHEVAAEKAAPAHSQIYTFYAEVDEESVRACMDELGQWSRLTPGAAITIVFNSPGGNVIDGLALFDFIQQLKRSGHYVTTIALGEAASMGGILLQAGDKRVIGANAFMLIHEVSSGSQGKASVLKDSLEFVKRLQKSLLTILAQRSKLSVDEIAKNWERRDWWLDADEAVKLGFADEILGTKPGITVGGPAR